MTLETLHALGAPDLPVGWFYRIKREDGMLPDLVTVEIREHYNILWWRVSRCHESSGGFASRYFDNIGWTAEQFIGELCIIAYDKMSKRRKMWAQFEQVEAYFGDHE